MTTITQEPLASTPQLHRIHTTGTWSGALRTDLTVGRFDFATAEPVSLGGHDSAPSPMDYVVGSFLGCLTVVLELVLNERDIAVHAIESEATGVIDTRGFAGVAGVSPHFQALSATVHVDAGCDAAAFREVIGAVERRCPAYNLFRDAGDTPDVTWILAGRVI